MEDERLTLFDQLVASVLQSPGTVDTSLRNKIAQQTAQHVNTASDTSDPGIPSELQTYVAKVARHAYKTTDGDVDKLKAEGYSEDVLYEITMSVAIGAGLNVFTSGLAAIKGASDASQDH